MSSPVLVSEVIEDVRQRCGLPVFAADTFVTAAAVLRMVQESAQRLSGVLHKSMGDDYFTTSGNLSTQVGVSVVSLPTNFYKLRRLAWIKSASERIPLEMAGADDWDQGDGTGWSSGLTPKYRVIGNTIELFPTPQTVETLKTHYTTGIFVTATTDTINSHFGWVEWIVNDVCGKIRQRQQKDPQEFWALKQGIEAELMAQAPQRDQWGQSAVRDTYEDTDSTYRPRPWIR